MIKKTNVVLALITLLLISVVNARASEHESKQFENDSSNHQQIVKKLNLDDSTSKALLELMKSHRSKHHEHRNMSKEQHHATREQHRNAVKSLLGEEKFLQFKNMMRRRHKKHGEKECSRGKGKY
ncbi:MAG: hypothetical protein QM484_01680 [Woeseiaceae bacterium]